MSGPTITPNPIASVQTNRLGRTDLRVSALSFGAGPLGEDYGPFDPAEGERAVHAAIDRGINFFDTAPYYGRGVSETRLGTALRGRRDEVLISTKVGRYDRELPHGFDFRATRVERSVEESLARLQTDRIDLYIAHDIEFTDRRQVLEETLPAMRRLREQGKVRYLGVSGFPLEVLREVGVAGEVDVILSYCHYDLLNTRMASVLGPLAEEPGIGLINASPLHMGVLSSESPPGWHPAPPRVLEAARGAAELCRSRGAELATLALQFAMQSSFAATTLVGIRRTRDVEENLAAAGGTPDPELLREVQRLLAPVHDVEWPSGLPENNPPGVME